MRQLIALRKTHPCFKMKINQAKNVFPEQSIFNVAKASFCTSGTRLIFCNRNQLIRTHMSDPFFIREFARLKLKNNIKRPTNENGARTTKHVGHRRG